MKAIGIVGSPRKNGNTEILTRHALEAIAEGGPDTELITRAGSSYWNIAFGGEKGQVREDEEGLGWGLELRQEWAHLVKKVGS
ncbi:MAG: NAD(P)H-dependent oxidoreductase [Dehalococcoidales bacterium]